MDIPHPAWRRLLDACAAQAVTTIKGIPGVVDVVEAGSLGRNQPWPLSDIDLLPIYEDDDFERASAAVEAARISLLDRWTGEGHASHVDVGKLAFRRSEVEAALTLTPADATTLLTDDRWFYSLDKGYGGHAAGHAADLASDLATWFTQIRFAPEVVRARQALRRSQLLHWMAQAKDMLAQHQPDRAAVSLRQTLHVLLGFLLEGWGARDNSWGRLGTRLDTCGVQHHRSDLIDQLWHVYGFSRPEVLGLLALAPEGVQHRHRRSYVARQLIGEGVTDQQDARDVLLVYSTREVRMVPPPFPLWTGVRTDQGMVSERVAEGEQLVNQALQIQVNSS